MRWKSTREELIRLKELKETHLLLIKQTDLIRNEILKLELAPTMRENKDRDELRLKYTPNFPLCTAEEERRFEKEFRILSKIPL